MKKLLFLLLVLPTSILFGQAVNDECANRLTISPGVGAFNEFSVDTSTATESLDASCETASQVNLDVWYEFTMPVNGNIRITNIPNTVYRTLYDTCGGVDLVCGSDDGFFYNLTSGTTYVLRMSERSLFASADDFTIQAFETAANDECVNRNNIIVNTGSVTYTTLDFRTATESVDGPCEAAGNTQHDLWYEFTI